MTKPASNSRKFSGRLLAGLALLLPCGHMTAHATPETEIVSVIGKGDKRDAPQGDWLAAAPRQTVKAGGFVRTHDMSQMALLLPDRTQLRLNQNSLMQIKTQTEAAEWNQTAVKLNSGRAWSQARPAPAGQGALTQPAKITMETPSATLSIRGTDWEVEVGPDGGTQLVVLSGIVDIANEHGALLVNPGEAARAEIGKAPVRLLLANPADRIQWVTAWQVQPRRWVSRPGEGLLPIIRMLETGDYANAARQLEPKRGALEYDLLRADLAAMNGDSALAASLLEPHVNGSRSNAVAIALLARIHLAKGDAASAATLLEGTLVTRSEEVEIWLATAELAHFRGDATGMRNALDKAVNLDTANAEAWLARGSLETERENFRDGRTALDHALTTKPEFPHALAERGTLETLAGDFAMADLFYSRVLTVTPDDYIALTGRGILRLKTGHPASALDDFLRAGVLEPRFARAWLYSAAAFYQLGESRRAKEALKKATLLDPHDPLPHVMLGLIAADELDLGNAVATARNAQERMPFLKSLNQVLNNQKGSANVGSALAAFGMDEWARHYATTAYSPWWAGSHLFLADRQTPGFNKNSELFKGFIADPLVFGASQRYSSLLPTPGHHGRADFFVEQSGWQQNALIGTANGLATSPLPLAYFISGDLSTGESRSTGDNAKATNLTLGLGARPHHALGVFLFGTDTRTRGDLQNPTLPNDPLDIKESRYDFGINYKHDAGNQFWLKTGTGRQTAFLEGLLATSNFGTVPLDQYRYHVDQSDTQFRHSFAPIENAWLSWGYEDARQRKPANMDLQVQPTSFVEITELTTLHSQDAYLVVRGPLASQLRGELGMFGQRAHSTKRSATHLNGGVMGTPENSRQQSSDTLWRSGLQWQFGSQSTLTAVSQNWRRPASTGSLAPIDTLGIPVNDRLTTNGGLYRRQRVQIDHEASQSIFIHGFADNETIDNLYSPLSAVVPDLQLTQLESLRNRRDAFSVDPELEKSPQFLEGRVRSLGMAMNYRITTNQTLSLRYRHADAEQTGARAGLQIPYVPRDYLRLASHWSLPDRWLIGVTGTWRAERFRDEANTLAQRIDPGWTFGLNSYWESADKRWVAQVILDNLQRNHKSSDESASKLILRASYLF